MTDRCS